MGIRGHFKGRQDAFQKPACLSQCLNRLFFCVSETVTARATGTTTSRNGIIATDDDCRIAGRPRTGTKTAIDEVRLNWLFSKNVLVLCLGNIKHFLEIKKGRNSPSDCYLDFIILSILLK